MVTFDSSVARAGDEIYTVIISSDNYVDMTKNITLTGQPITVSNVSYYWVKGAVDGYTQIPGRDIYYKVANGHEALTGNLYGTASLSYEEFYAEMQRAVNMIPLHLQQQKKELLLEMQMFRI